MAFQTVESFKTFVNNGCDPVLRAGMESVLTGKEAKVADMAFDVDIRWSDEHDSEFVKPLVSLSPILGIKKRGQIRVVSDKAKALVREATKQNLNWYLHHNGWYVDRELNEVFYLVVKA